MSKKTTKKKTVVAAAAKSAPARARTQTASAASLRPFTFNKDNYIWMGIGFALVLIGLALMSGGHMPSPDVWDENIIYSTRRTLIAPIVILAGLGVEVYAIFKK